MTIFCHLDPCPLRDLPVPGDDPDDRVARRLLHRTDHLLHLVAHLLLRELALSDVTQEQIDAAIATLQGDEDGLDAATTAIADEIAALQAANPGLDVSALLAKVDDLKPHVDAVAALAPAPPAPPAEG